MKPYFENDSVTLYRGDCREVLPELTGTVNLLLTDPPYSRVKSDGWDRCSHLELETLLRDVFTAILPQNGQKRRGLLLLLALFFCQTANADGGLFQRPERDRLDEAPTDRRILRLSGESIA